MTTDTAPERVSPPDFWNLMAREVYAMPEGWAWFRLESVGPDHSRDLCVSMVTGAVCTAKYTKGPNKGSPNWKRRDRATEQTIAIPFRDLDAFCEAWERKTGLCASCGGSGEAITGWNGETGNSYCKCVRCFGSGRYSPVI
jgi:hypothetical protein